MKLPALCNSVRSIGSGYRANGSAPAVHSKAPYLGGRQSAHGEEASFNKVVPERPRKPPGKPSFVWFLRIEPSSLVLKLRFFRRVWAHKGGLPPFCEFGQNGGDEGDHSPNAEEGASRADHAGCTPTVQVVPQARLPEAARPTIGSSLRDRLPHASGQDVSLPCCRRYPNRCEA